MGKKGKIGDKEDTIISPLSSVCRVEVSSNWNLASILFPAIFVNYYQWFSKAGNRGKGSRERRGRRGRREK
jgi:hypothetical protein